MLWHFTHERNTNAKIYSHFYSSAFCEQEKLSNQSIQTLLYDSTSAFTFVPLWCSFVELTIQCFISANPTNEDKQGQFLGSSMYSNGETFIVSNIALFTCTGSIPATKSKWVVRFCKLPVCYWSACVSVHGQQSSIEDASKYRMYKYTCSSSIPATSNHIC